MYRDIIKYSIEYILQYWNVNSPEYNEKIFEDGSPYDFEYFGWLVPCLKDKDIAYKLTPVLCQKPTAFMELDYSKSDHDYVHLPCETVKFPDSVVYPVVKKLVDDSLEYRLYMKLILH